MDGPPDLDEEDREIPEQKRIILIRHSESINNVAKRDAHDALKNMKSLSAFPTWSQVCSTASLLAVPMNTDLSEEGVRMVSSLRSIMDGSNFLRTHNVELVVHSPLLRAARTCSVLFGDKGIPIFENGFIFEKNISEHCSISDMSARIALFVEWLVCRPERCIVVVGHSAFFREMLATEIKMKNCEVRSCVLNIDGSFDPSATVTIIDGGDAL